MSEEPPMQVDDEVPPADFILRDTTLNSIPEIEWDERLYLPKHSGWEAAIKQTWEQEFCYSRNPGEDWFHLLANGEIYVQRGSEKFCLTCALRHKILTRNRLFWQKGAMPPEDDKVRQSFQAD